MTEYPILHCVQLEAKQALRSRMTWQDTVGHSDNDLAARRCTRKCFLSYVGWFGDPKLRSTSATRTTKMATPSASGFQGTCLGRSFEGGGTDHNRGRSDDCHRPAEISRRICRQRESIARQKFRVAHDRHSNLDRHKHYRDSAWTNSDSLTGSLVCFLRP